jgi:hypothetical protein
MRSTGIPELVHAGEVGRRRPVGGCALLRGMKEERFNDQRRVDRLLGASLDANVLFASSA